MHDVSKERLRRFFVEVDGKYQITKSIRDACVFARHNVLSDPPFSRIDLVSCRNMLIYLGGELQQKVIPILHYALRPNGFLWLGTSETIGPYRDLFELHNVRNKIYAKKPVPGQLPVTNKAATIVLPALLPSAAGNDRPGVGGPEVRRKSIGCSSRATRRRASSSATISRYCTTAAIRAPTSRPRRAGRASIC